jgi:phage gpG-like protein
MKLTLALAGGCWLDGDGCCLSARARAGTIHPARAPRFPAEKARMTVYSLLGMAAKLHAMEADMKLVTEDIVAQACAMVAEEAKRVLGTHDYGWVDLKPETIARKMRGDTPLLETGKMRASIQWNASGNEGYVGSNDLIAVYQELGTSKIPPRPFLSGAAIAMEAKIHKMAGRAVTAVLAGKGLNSVELRELLHLLRELKHVAKEAWETFGPEGEDEGKRK